MNAATTRGRAHPPARGDPLAPHLVIDAVRRLASNGICPGGGAPGVGRVLRVLALAAFVLVLVAMVCVALYIGRRDTGTAFGLGVALAALPVPLYLALVIWADRFEPEPVILLVAVFLWGAGAALVIAYTINTEGGDVVAGEVGVNARVYIGSVSAPIFEELLKAVPLVALLVVAREKLDDFVDGVVYAGMVGLGFAMSENILYYGRAALAGGLPDALDVFVLRGVWAPFMHPLFTTATGVGVAYAATRPGPIPWRWPAVGLVTAMALHSLWNTGVRSSWFDVVYGGLFLPLFAGVVYAVLRVRAHEARVLARYLPKDLGRDAALPTELEPLTSLRRRRELRLVAHRRAGAEGRHAAAAYEHAAIELAFLERRLDRDGALDDGRYDGYRQELRRRLLYRRDELRELGVLT